MRRSRAAGESRKAGKARKTSQVNKSIRKIPKGTAVPEEPGQLKARANGRSKGSIENRGENRARKRVRDTYKVVLAGLLIALGTGGILLVQGFQKGSPPGGSSRQFEGSVSLSSEKPPTAKEMSEELQKEADASSFRFKMNTRPVLTEKQGDWCIINSVENRHHMVVSVKDGEGRELYRSRELRPGEQEMTGYLTEELEKGEHRAVATAFAIDPETGEVAGSVETELILTVEGEGSLPEEG